MGDFQGINLRNIGFIGHSGAGKTTLTEAILYNTKAIDRFGKIEEGNTLSDYDIEEKKRKISISTSMALCKWRDNKINLVDIPGYFDFLGEMIQGLQAVDLAMIVVCSVSGVEVGTEKAWSYVKNERIPRAFFINKLDRENSSFKNTLSELQDSFGSSVIPIHYPIGEESNFKGVVNIISGKARILNNNKIEFIDVPKELEDEILEYKTMIMEAVAETDEALLEKYFDCGELSNEEIYEGILKSSINGDITPVMCGSALQSFSIESLLEDTIECFPSPIEASAYRAKDINKGEVNVNINPKDDFSAIVFKTVADPFIGKLSIFRVITGSAKSDSIVYNSNKKKEERLGTLYYLKGKEQIATKEIVAGDIGAVSKLQFTTTGDTLCDKNKVLVFENKDYPKPSYCKAILPISKGDEEKISTGLSKLLDEDPTFKVFRGGESSECIVYGMGSIHLDILGSKLKNKFGVDVRLQTPKVSYRETIKKVSDVQGKHKKQSGGHGQYGDVKIKFEPRLDGEENLEFVDKVVGGVVPRQYIPAVEKGLKECMEKGIVAGYPVIKLRATLHDGSYHAVDSSEMAFKIAASLAFKKGLKEAEPILLEPIMYAEIVVPDNFTGDIISDINRKRGKIMGMEPMESSQKIIVEVPQSEMFEYAMDLRAMTSGRGEFIINFARYDELPKELYNKVIEECAE